MGVGRQQEASTHYIYKQLEHSLESLLFLEAMLYEVVCFFFLFFGMKISYMIIEIAFKLGLGS